MALPGLTWRANRRFGLRCFRSTPSDVILLALGLCVTVVLVARQYRGGRPGADGDEVENPLREISLRWSAGGDDDDDDGKARGVRPRSMGVRNMGQESIEGSPSNDATTIDPRVKRIGDYRSERCFDKEQEVGFGYT